MRNLKSFIQWTFNKWTNIGTKELPVNRNTCPHGTYIPVWGWSRQETKLTDSFPKWSHPAPWFYLPSIFWLLNVHIQPWCLPGTPDSFTWLPIQCLHLGLMGPSSRTWPKQNSWYFLPKSVPPTAYPMLINCVTIPPLVQIKTWESFLICSLFFTFHSVSKSCKFHHQDTCWICPFLTTSMIITPIKAVLNSHLKNCKQLLIGHPASTFSFI